MIVAALVVLALLGGAPWWVAHGHAQRRLDQLAGHPGRRGARRRWIRGCRAGQDVGLDMGVLLGLVAAATRSGAALPRALHTVGRAVGGVDGAALERVSAALLLGMSWSAAWEQVPDRLEVVGRALGPAWEHGAPPAEALQVAGAQLRADRQSAAATAAARLGVRLVVPLGLCYLPAFVLIGLVPLLVSMGSRFVE